ARLSYGKVAEYQRRGLIHFHAAIRLDGPEGATDEPPTWATAGLLEDAIIAACAAARVTTARPEGTRLDLTWGDQLDVRRIETDHDDGGRDRDGLSDERIAGYIAKYATKGTGKSEAADKPIRSQLEIDFLKISEHHRRMVQACWDLGGLEQYADLNLRRWAHMLGFRGHFLTKSLRYSTTFRVIRGDRRAYRLAQTLERLGLTDQADDITVINHWEFTGSGYRDDAERELAAGIAARIRQDRQTKYAKEY